MIYILDSHAWIEYFQGTNKGEEVRGIIINKDNRIITLECNLAVIYDWCNKKSEDFEKAFKTIKSNSLLKSLNLANWIFAAKIKIQQRKINKDFGLIDALLISKQKELNAKIVTGDNHFKNMKEVIFLGN